jgi:hypothetical protein
LAKSDLPEAVQLVLKSGRITPGFAHKHFEQMLTFAQGLTSEQAGTSPNLVDRLCKSGDKRVISVVEKWARQAKDEGTKRHFQSLLQGLREPASN